MPTLPVDGAERYYEDTGGTAPPIVFSHGLLWDHRTFAPQIAALRDRFRCIAYDHRGQGRSTGGTSHYGMEVLASDAVRLIEKLGIAPCHFVGLSMGGFVGIRLAAERPELIRSLTLVESAGDPEPRWNVPKYTVMVHIARLLGLRPLLRPVMKIMFGDTFRNDPARLAERREMEKRLLELDPERLRWAVDAVITRDSIEDLLPRITAGIRSVDSPASLCPTGSSGTRRGRASRRR